VGGYFLGRAAATRATMKRALNFGGGIANNLSVRLGSDLSAAVLFYGAQPSAADAAKIKAPLLLLYRRSLRYLRRASR